MSSTLVKVQAYAGEAMPMFNAYTTYVALCNKSYQGWSEPGLKGPSVLIPLPTIFNISDTLSFDSSIDGSFTQRYSALTIDTEKSIQIAMTDQEIQAYSIQELTDQYVQTSMSQLAEVIDKDVAETACLGGYRWVGDINASSNSLLDVQQLRIAVTKVRNYGTTGKLNVILPDNGAVHILNTSLQEFTPSTNDSVLRNWELGSLRGSANADFYESQLNPIHYSGTASLFGELTIANVFPSTYVDPQTNSAIPASTITISGVPSGTTVVVNDVGDIGSKSTTDSSFNSKEPLRFLRPQAKTLTNLDAQFKVVVGGTEASGSITFQVIPQFIFDGTNTNTSRNLNRAIDTTKDVLRIAKTHQCGNIHNDKTLYFTAPKLPTTEPFNSVVKVDSDTKISMRCYHGYVFGKAKSMLSTDIRYGKHMAPDYGVRMIFPVSM